MSAWRNFWVHGLRAALEAWIEAKKIDDGYGGRVLPNEILVVGPCFPHEQDGTTPEGLPKYKRKTGAVKCLWLFSIYGDAQDLIDEVKVLQGPYDIHDTMDYEYEDFDGNVMQGERQVTIEDIRQLYPDFALGQGIPYIC